MTPEATKHGNNKRLYSPIRVAGADRARFLQGQLTQDVATLPTGRPVRAGWADPKGRLRCLMWVYAWQDAIWLLLPTALAEATRRQLQMYVLRADVQLDTEGHEVSIVTISAARALTGTDIATEEGSIGSCFYNTSYFALRPGMQTDLCLLTAAAGAIPATAGPEPQETWRLAEIRAGIPSVWPGTVGHFVPQMLNLDVLGALNFSKGCYVGQEIVARTQNLGRIKRRMFRLTASEAVAAQPGDVVWTGADNAGEVVDAVTTGSTTELLAVLSLDRADRSLSLDEAGTNSLTDAGLPYALETPSV